MELLARNGRVFARIFFGFEEGVCVADALAADAERLLDRLGIHALAQQVLLELLTHHFPALGGIADRCARQGEWRAQPVAAAGDECAWHRRGIAVDLRTRRRLDRRLGIRQGRDETEAAAVAP